MKSRFVHWSILLVMLINLLAVTPARASQLIVVDTNLDEDASNSTCSLREAIIAANTDSAYKGCIAGSGADNILFHENYFIVLGSQLPAVTSTISISNYGMANQMNIWANAQPQTATYRIFSVSSGGNLTLEGLTLKNGNCPGACFGGAITSDGVLKLSNVILSNNSASLGGAVYSSNGQLTIVSSTLSYNNAQNGGAVYATGNTVIQAQRNRIFNNVATGYGGAVYLDSGITGTLTENMLLNNYAANHGGAIYTFGDITVSKDTIYNNLSEANGGGIYNHGTLALDNSTFYNNQSYIGGGLYNTTSATLNNVTLSGNEGLTAEVHNISGASLTIRNSILANGVGGVDCYNSGTIGAISTNYLIESNGAGANACGTPSVTADPKLGPLANNGGTTLTMALLAGSPAINTGSPGGICLTADQRGVARPQAGTCDIGAYEKLPALASPTFADVPFDHWAWQYVESIFNSGITGGCGNGNYCPNTTVTRAQMAVFLLKGMHGAGYVPPAAQGTVFTDVPANHWAAAWIEQLASEGITGGCGGGNFCPDAPITRDQMAVFLLLAKYGSKYIPIAASGNVFDDVPANFWAAAWIEQLAAEGITGGCGGGKYCPKDTVTRAQMAVFLQTTFNLILP